MVEKWHCNLLLAISWSVATSAVGFASGAQISDHPVKRNETLFGSAKRSWVATISMGPVWANGMSQTLYLTSDIEKTYAANHVSPTLVDGEIFLGMQRRLHEKIEGQIGLAVATTSNASLSGDIWDDADALFNNYTYNYRVRHTHLALKGKLLAADRGYIVIPWISGSLGVGFNQAHDFSNTPTISAALTTPNFGNNTTTALVYTLGIGVERQLNLHWQMGVGYEFSDWGKNQLSTASDQTVNNGLSFAHLYINGLLFNLTYCA